MREFTDSHGVDWRAWDVTPAQMHPVTRGEDYMADLQDGWLAFESAHEKRRLEAPYPANWKSFSIPKLEELIRRSSPVIRRRGTTPSGQRRAISAAEIEKVSQAQSDARRTFTSPGGREWIVRIHECLDQEGKQQTVLRFTAGDIVVDLRAWPEHWRDASVVEFAMMLLDADPPRRMDTGKGPQRRHEDRRD